MSCEGDRTSICIWSPLFDVVALFPQPDRLSQMGEANASIPTLQPVHRRLMFWSFDDAMASRRFTYAAMTWNASTATTYNLPYVIASYSFEEFKAIAHYKPQPADANAPEM